LESLKSSPFEDQLEADESYFGPRRVRGKRGRGAGGKTIVFGLLKRTTRSTRRLCQMHQKPRYEG
jgi:transposase-like protein